MDPVVKMARNEHFKYFNYYANMKVALENISSKLHNTVCNQTIQHNHVRSQPLHVVTVTLIMNSCVTAIIITTKAPTRAVIANWW